MSETIGFIGLGNMGQAMAGNLLKAGFTLIVYNRTLSKAEALTAKGARLARKPEEAAPKGGIVITMVANDQALEDIVMSPGFLDRLMIAEKRHTPAGFRLALGLKDINLVGDTAEHPTMPMPLQSMLHDRPLAAIAKGRGDMDWSAVSLEILDDAGLKVQDQN